MISRRHFIFVGVGTHSVLARSAKIAISLSISTASPPMIAEKGEMESAVPAIPLVLLFRLDGPRQIRLLGVMCYHDE